MLKNKMFIISIIVTCMVLAIALPCLVYSDTKLEKLEMNPLALTGSNGYFNDLKVDTAIPQIPSQMKVYKVKDLNLSKEDMNKLMNKFEMKGEVKVNDREFAVVDGEKTLVLDKKTGSYNYYTKKLTSAVKPIQNLLSDEEYKKLAEKYLTEKNLMKDGAYYRKTLRHTVGKVGQPEQVCLVETVFTKDLNGQRFSGVGPKICVFFGENGEIIGTYSVWKEVEEYNDYPIIDVQKAIDNVLNRKAIIANAGKGDSGSINNIEIIYDMESLRSNQKYVIPYYMIKGENVSGNDFTALTRAVPEEYISETYLDDVSARKHYNKDSKEIVPHREDED